LTEAMQNTIEILKGELAEKNELINRLTATIDKMAVISDFHNKVLNNVSLQIEPPKIKKLTWWQRFFKSEKPQNDVF
jgi:hypothetical protein